MKLSLGENIRRLRKEAGITQEQLAEKLGVSYQSVSRWELSATYPDMELIPSLAAFFGVSADILLGMPRAHKEKEAEKALTELAHACRENPIVPEKICSIIRGIRRDHMDAKCFWNFWFSGNSMAYRHPDVLPEVRLTVERLLEGNSSGDVKNEAIKCFASIEDEEHLEAFLSRYAATEDLQKDTLLFDRYRHRGDKKNADLLRQQFLFDKIDSLVGNSGLWHMGDPENLDLPNLHAKNRLGIHMLHTLCQAKDTQTYPISGDGKVDMWVEPRLWMGFHEVGYLAAEGDTEQAFLVLEDTVALLEAAMTIQAPTSLTCTSPWLKDMAWTAMEEICTNTHDPNLQERALYMTDKRNCCFMVYPSEWEHYLTTRTDDRWYTRECHLMDSIREHPRYLACVDRVKKLIICTHV